MSRARRRFLDRLPSIRAKLGFVIVFAVGMTVVLVYLLFGYALRESARDQGRLELLRAAQSLADGTAAMGSDGRLALPHAVLPLSLAPDGHFSSVFAGAVYRVPDPLPPRFLDGGVHVGTTRGWDYAAVSRFAHGHLVVVAYAVRRAPNEGVLGSLGATLGFLRRYGWQLLVGGALAAGIALILARFLARGMTQPLREMAGAAGEMARGQYGRRVTTESRDEVGQLAAAFNRMAAELEQVERLR
ncbi:MAG TPA: HAMP domain-containing protein, partial [Actinomycetota bacterium]|nr:HAMP domain-containing protein [Actinomycetota bacterium]